MCKSGDGRLYSTGEVARLLGVSQSTVQSYISRGLLKPDYAMPSSRDGKSGRRKFKRSTIDAFIEVLQRNGGS